MKKYQIVLKRLSSSETYEYVYELGDDFFEGIDAPEVRRGNIHVELKIMRVASSFELNFRITGTVTVACDRCLEDVEIPVDTENKLIVSLGKTYEELDAEHVIIPEEDGFIDVAWFMYEFIVLSIPMKRVHEQEGCNEVMAQKLKELCVSSNEDN